MMPGTPPRRHEDPKPLRAENDLFDRFALNIPSFRNLVSDLSGYIF
jgi:hypothetical protein